LLIGVRAIITAWPSLSCSGIPTAQICLADGKMTCQMNWSTQTKMHALTSSLLNALVFGQHEWFMQLCKKEKSVIPAREKSPGTITYTDK